MHNGGFTKGELWQFITARLGMRLFFGAILLASGSAFGGWCLCHVIYFHSSVFYLLIPSLLALWGAKIIAGASNSIYSALGIIDSDELPE